MGKRRWWGKFLARGMRTGDVIPRPAHPCPCPCLTLSQSDSFMKFPKGSTYPTLSDGRRLCPECRDSAIMDDQAFKALEHEIREFYDYLGMKVHQRTIPLYLVNEQEMKESKARDGKNNVEGRRHTLVAHSRVVSIRVLYGLPRLFTGQILTHEMMHAWHVLEIDGYFNLSLEVKEGLCEVLAHTWLGSQIRSMSKSKAAPSPLFDFEKKLAKFLRHGIESRTDHPYGTGFQLVKRATDMYGLKGTLDYIRMTGGFPS
ncbi:hypothetical protein NL676_014475 [Syzygium grande]|nr:hypothetical protein NL676_014475 [Syzygium grande]